MKTTAVLMAMLVPLVTSDPHLLDNCIVQDEESDVLFSTFKDSVSISMVAYKQQRDVLVTVTQGDTEQIIQPNNLQTYVWLKGLLSLTDQPELQLSNKTYKPDRVVGITKGTRKDIKIENAHVLMRCPEGWPNRELKNRDTADIEIASTGLEERLMLIPAKDTKVSFSVGGKKKTLCLKNNSLALYNGSSECEDLKQLENYKMKLKYNEETHTVQIFGGDDHELDKMTYTDKTLKFLRENLADSLYISQCIPPCTASSGSTLSCGASAAVALAVFLIVRQLYDASVPFISGSRFISF